MIVTFFNHGTGKASGAINYLLGEEDSEGKIRNPEPEIFYGDKDITEILIDSNSRKYKYTSGAIAFRDNEKPTKKEMQQIIKSMYEVFCPGLGPDKINMFVVKHEDKGNTELHFVVPMVEISTMKQFNINPPGKHSQQLARDFQAIWNHKLGYEQVIEDPLKAQLTKFDLKSQEGSRSQKIKNRTSTEIAKLLRSGKIENRDQLCDYLSKKGIEVTRKGREYISIKLPGQKKATRLYGPVFEKNSDYKELVLQADNFLNNKSLNEFQVFDIKKRMDESIQYRRDFNKKTYTNKKRIPKGSKLHTSKPRSTTNPSSKANINANISNQSKPTAKENNRLNTGKISKSKSNGSQNATSSPVSGGVKSGASAGIRKSLASVQVSIIAAMADLANAKTPEERANAESKIAELRKQEEQLQWELMEALKVEINNEPTTPRKPRIR